MAKIYSIVSEREPIGQTAIVVSELLRARSGLTAAQIKEKTGQVNMHGSQSLLLIAERYGLRLIITDRTDTRDGKTRYRFERKPAKPTRRPLRKPVRR